MRLLDDWVNSYIEYTEHTEPPISYHTWMAISVIAGALQRKCVFKWGHSNIYPNQYIILVGPSGQSRKGEAITIARHFVDYLNLPIAATSLTRESLIKKMGTASSFPDANGQVKFQSPLTIISDELSVLLGQKEFKLLADLTDWWDSRDMWRYETKWSGNDEIKGVCVNMAAATAPDWLPSILPQEAVGGGFTSRCIFVVETYKGKIVPNPNLYGIDEGLRKRLEKDLEEIHQLTGEFLFDDEALENYITWYSNYEEAIKRGNPPIPDPKFAGYVSRRATHIKKLCMCLSASRGDDLIVNGEDFQRALILLTSTEKKMSRAFAGLGQARFSDISERILEYIHKRKTVLRSELLMAFRRDLDMYMLEQIERLLESMKQIEIILLQDSRDVRYVFVGEDKDKTG